MKLKIKKHPLAIEWENWINSSEGQSCMRKEFGTVDLKPELLKFLQNRFWFAFHAGVNAAKKTREDFEFSQS